MLTYKAYLIKSVNTFTDRIKHIAYDNRDQYRRDVESLEIFMDELFKCNKNNRRGLFTRLEYNSKIWDDYINWRNR